VNQQLPKYFKNPATFEFYQQDGFYDQYDSKGRAFLRTVAPSVNNDLIIFGTLEFDRLANEITVQVDGYDGQNNTDWVVFVSPFSPSSLSYLTEVYTQLIFDLINEPTTGLKPTYSEGI